MERNWPRIIGEVLASEGGFVNDPQDKGGATNLGVTIANFRAYVKPDGTVDDLKALTRDQAATVFKRHYWQPVMGADLPDGVDYAVVDFAINSGNGPKVVQRVVGAKSDGVFGPDTMSRVKAISPALLVSQICDARLSYLRNLDGWDHFGAGWSSRVEKVRKIAMQMAQQGAAPAPVQVVEKTVPVEVEKPVPVVPKGSDKRAWLWGGMSSISLSTIVSGFVDVPWQAKVGAGIVALATVVIMLFIGDRIIRRVKTLRDEINAG